MKRRNFIKSVGVAAAAAYVGPEVFAGSGSAGTTGNVVPGVPEFPALPYAYDALEPYIDARTMEIHYDKHFRGYYNKFVAAVKGTPLEKMSLNDIFSGVSSHGGAVRNNAGGFYNHSLFWTNLGKGSKGPDSELSSALTKAFGSFDKFKEAFDNAAKTRFGSGWAWLYLKPDKSLAIGSTPNQDNTLMDVSEIKGTPLLALDVWEHAYYLKYQNRRPEYIDAFWHVVNWDEVNKRYSGAMG
ncbi:MAG TPA: superoxide dismutase [Bacteroidales bacterium]|nr:superoxide dismutase [Bacteroidales bacterium]